jgi:TP901 family phage tail tape measure protein
MAKKISSSDLFDKEDIFEGIRLSAQKTIEDLKKIDSEFKRVAQTMRETLGKSKVNTTQGIQEFTKATQDANKAVENSIKIEKLKSQAEQQALKAEQEREKVAQQKAKTAREEAKEQERLNRLHQKTEKIARDEANAYKQLEKSTRELKNESKQLGAELLKLEKAGKRNTKEYRELEKQYKQTTKAAQQGDAQLKKLDKTVGDNQRNVGNYIGGVKSLAGAFGMAFGVGTVANLFTTGAEAMVEFDQAIADLQAITGASGQDLEYYREQANKLGIDVEGGASAVVEAYKLIGSAKPELLTNAEALNSVTKSAITLAQAAGMSVPDAAKNLTDAMNQFGASAEDADKFINVLAAGSKFGAVEIPQVTEALLKFGAVAKTSGVSIEETGALIEALGERGLKGAEAGTALRNIMLKLSAPDALPKDAIARLTELGINFDTLKDKSIPFTQRLEALKPLLNDQAALVKTFGTENAVAATNLIQLTDRTDELRQQMTGTNTAYEQAETRNATLGHAIMQLKNAFIALFTGADGGSDVMSGLAQTIQWVARNLNTIVKIVITATRMYVTFRAATAAQTLANKVLGGSFATVAQKVGIMKAALMGLNRGLKSLKTAIASNPFGLLITAATEIYANWDSIAGLFGVVTDKQKKLTEAEKASAQAQKEAAERAKNLKEEQESLNKQMNDEKSSFLFMIESLKKTNAGSKERSTLISEINSKYGTTLTNMNNELAFQKQLNVASAEWLKNQEAKYKLQANEKKFVALMEEEQKINENIAKIEEGRKKFTPQVTAVGATGIQRASQQQAIDKRAAENKARLDAEIKKGKQRLAQIQVEKQSISTVAAGQSVLAVANDKVTKSNGALSKSTVQVTTTFEELNKEQSRALELLQQLSEQRQTKQLEEQQRAIDYALTEEIKRIEAGGSAQVDALEKIVYQRFEMERQFSQEKLLYDIEQIQINYELQKKARQKRLDDEKADLEKAAKKEITDKALLRKKLNEIDKNYQIRQAELNQQEIDLYADVQLEKEVKKGEFAKRSVQISEIEGNEINRVNDAVFDAESKRIEKLGEKENETGEKDLEALKKREEEKRAIVEQTAEIFTKQSEKRVEQIEKEMAKAQEQLDHYKELAASGNINAQQSLAQQQKIIDEANRKKEQELQRQQRIKLAESVYSTYSQKVESGSKNPLAETIRDTTLLQQFINSLPAFMEGTEDTGTNGRGVDGKGGFQAILHPNERVIPKHLNEQIGSISNVDLARIAQEYKNGKIVEGGKQTKSALEFALLVNELQELKSVIQNKPETNIELGQITNSVMEIVQSRKQGNSVTYNRFKVRK